MAEAGRSEDLKRAFAVFEQILDQLRGERRDVKRIEAAQERLEKAQRGIRETLQQIRDTQLRGETHGEVLKDHEARLRAVERRPVIVAIVSAIVGGLLSAAAVFKALAP